MKTGINKAFLLVAAAVMVISFTACKTEETEQFSTIEAKDCFDSAGYIEFISGAEEKMELDFAAQDSENAEWSVYVFDEAFSDGFRYISQAAEPVLVGDGTVLVEEGQFVYVYCSVNGFTADSPDENAKLNITFE